MIEVQLENIQKAIISKSIAEPLYISGLDYALHQHLLVCVYDAKVTPLRFRGKTNNIPLQGSIKIKFQGSYEKFLHADIINRAVQHSGFLNSKLLR